MRMIRVLAAMVLMSGCTDDEHDPANARPGDPKTCEGLEAITTDAPDVGEVLLDGYVRTPGISYHCDDVSTWSYYARRRNDNGRLGSFGKFRIESAECMWVDAIDQRASALGTCP